MISSSSTTSTRPSPCTTRARLPGLPRPCRRIGRRSGAGAGERASCPSGLVILLCLAGPPVPAASPAPIAQGIEQRPPEPCAQVRILLGAPRKHQRKLSLTSRNQSGAVFLVPPSSAGLSRRPSDSVPV